MHYLFIGTFLLLVGGNTLAAVGGKANFTGKATKPAKIAMDGDAVCHQQNGGKPVLNETLVVSDKGGLANVFVYVKEGVKPESVPPVPTEPVVLDQKGCAYYPHVLGIRVGQPLKVLNSDPTMHNVHSMPKTNSSFNFGMSTKGSTVEKKFSKPELGVRIKCDVHGWMNGWANVVDHPYFAVTDTSGKFTINGLPDGDYTLEAWHEKLGTQTQKISVKGGNATTDFSFAPKG